MTNKLIAFISFLLFAFASSAQSVNSDTMAIRRDTIRRFTDPRAQIKPYEEVIRTGYTSWRGLFTVHLLKDTVYFEIPESILGRDIEVINSLVQGPGGTHLYSGEDIDEKTIFFEHGDQDSSIRIRYDWIISSADSGSNIFKAVTKSNLNPISISFPIKAYGPNEKTYVIDVSKWIRDPKCFMNSMDGTILSQSLVGPRDVTVSLVHAYPINVEISLAKNAEIRTSAFSRTPPQPATIITHTSFVELPDKPMEQRIQDDRVGFFADQEFHFSDDQQKVEDRRFILRWRLEPKDEDKEKFAMGELVEPKNPIVIYIDPATPKQWRPYLIEGINDWQRAFAKAGFKHAIVGKEWPEDDKTMHVDDARYSFINYMPSEIENAMGPNVHDPRSGEIIQTHIHWYHNVMQLLHSWYMVQAGAVDPKARHAKFDDELMGELIRFVSSHEVGHTLGLRHNMGSSSTVPVDSLRSRRWLDAHGHTPSIMDYARFDYVAQPEDNIPEHDLFPRIGEYDRWAIEWGYGPDRLKNSDENRLAQRKLVTDSLAANPRLWFGADDRETKRMDPRCQSEDLGNDAMLASEYGIKNLKRIVPNLPEWTKENDASYDDLNIEYAAVQDQFTLYMQHVMMNLGGVYTTPKTSSDKGNVVEPTPIAKQKEALEFFDQELFTTPYWILNSHVTTLVSQPKQPDFVEDLQEQVLNKLLDMKKIDQVLANERQFGEKGYSLEDYLGTIHMTIWKELKSSSPREDSYRRNLQKAYVGAFETILLSTTPENTETDAFSIIRADFLHLQKEVNSAIPRTSDKLTRYHLEDIKERIKKTLEAKPTIQ
ncbi:MAG TPA: zinc-dependent metalloprotease [Puia sp.]|nr:zinc-dependent metalloprotease [Puia sp.]